MFSPNSFHLNQSKRAKLGLVTYLLFIFSNCLGYSGNRALFCRFFSNSVKQLHLISKNCFNTNIDYGRSYNNTIFGSQIQDCSFSRISSVGYFGGVVFYQGIGYSVSISYSMFYSCSVSNAEGGAIYFDSSNLSLLMVCGHRCSADFGHFSVSTCTNENSIDMCSISQCSYLQNGYYSFHLSNGKQRVSLTNSSLNQVQYISGIAITSPESFTLAHCSFSNNAASSYGCVRFYMKSGTALFNNIIHNYSPSSSYGVVYAWGGGSYTMNYCVFYGNGIPLLHVSAGSTLNIRSSFIDHNSLNIGTAVFYNTSRINTKTYQFSYMQSYYCPADVPIIDTHQQSMMFKTIISNRVFVLTLLAQYIA